MRRFHTKVTENTEGRRDATQRAQRLIEINAPEGWDARSPPARQEVLADEQGVKIENSLSRGSVDFFKTAAGHDHTSYQMVRCVKSQAAYFQSPEANAFS